MDNLVIFPNQRRARKEASLWLARLDRELTEAEREELNEWLVVSPTHGQALIHMAESWDEFDVLSELADVFPLEARDHQPRWQLSPRRVAGLAVAASIFVVGWLTVSVGLDRITGVAEPVTVATGQTYETAVGEQWPVRLPDGSVVTLNTDSLIEVLYTQTERTILLLRGEANFDVAANSARPFLVCAGDQVVRAVGTAFNVELSTSDVEITVTEGTVTIGTMLQPGTRSPRVDPTHALTTLAGGEATVAQADDRIVESVDPQELDSRLAWQRGRLEFQGETLEALLAEFGRYTTVEFEVADPALLSRTAGGALDIGDVEQLLIALRDSLQINSAWIGEDRILLTAQ